MVANHSSNLLNIFGVESYILPSTVIPNVSLLLNGNIVVNVYEGCNAINVSILFIAFLFAYKGSFKRTLIFSFIGLISIYLFNLLRVSGLFLVALYFPNHLYLMHKFVFTGVVYAFVFLLWFIWVYKINHRVHEEDTKDSKNNFVSQWPLWKYLVYSVVKLKILYSTIAITALITLYLFQHFNYAELISLSFPPNTQFIINRTIRFFFNDLAVILLIYAIFNNKELLKIAFGIQLFEMLIILPLYFYFKLSLEGASEISSPLLSFVHRVVVNPIIMLLLIPAFWFQQNSLPR